MLSGVRAAGFKLTPQRVAIVRELAGDPSHPTAQELFARLEPVMPTMSFATVYNTLAALAAAGLCGSLSLSPGAARFDPNMAPHHHVVCELCGLVRDVPPSGSEFVNSPNAVCLDQKKALLGFEIRTVEHIYRGLCASCARRAALAPSGPRSTKQLSPMTSKAALKNAVFQRSAPETFERNVGASHARAAPHVAADPKPTKKSLSETKRRNT